MSETVELQKCCAWCENNLCNMSAIFVTCRYGIDNSTKCGENYQELKKIPKCCNCKSKAYVVYRNHQTMSEKKPYCPKCLNEKMERDKI